MINAEANNKIAIATIAYESSSESLEAQIAVGKVIRNRMKERCQTAKQVCLSPHQFSCWKDGKPTQKRTLTEYELKLAEDAWELSEISQLPANLYHDISVDPYWAHSPKVSFLCQIDNLMFYREIR